jgi:glucosamine kinase
MEQLRTASGNEAAVTIEDRLEAGAFVGDCVDAATGGIVVNRPRPLGRTYLCRGPEPAEPRLFLGIDAGGTGCRARIVDERGVILGEGLSGPATTRLGVEVAWASIQRAWSLAAEEADLDPKNAPNVVAGIGVAGLSRKGARAAFEAMPHPFAAVRFVTDAAAACLGAHSGKDGAIVLAGTGSMAFAIVGGREFRAGGYGFPVSDEGSGADLGLKCLQMALKAHDGRRPHTPMLSAVLGRFDHDPVKAICWMDAASATDYATFAPMVLQHADDGDPAAREIVKAGAEELGCLVRQMVEIGAPVVTLLGGLAVGIRPWLAPDLRRRLKPADADAVAGAIILAKSS